MAKKAIPLSEWSTGDFAAMAGWARYLASDLACDEGEEHDEMIGVTDHVAKVRGLAAHLRDLAKARAEGCV